MKILFIKPALNPVFLAPMWGDPLELEYLAASVPDHSVESLVLGSLGVCVIPSTKGVSRRSG
ncbi:MAG: hypothetical protein ABSG17_19400 [Spirochaetia bacterium]|jgi:hypothetical protein